MLACALLSTCLQAQTDPPATLREFVAKTLHWDVSKSGALMAIDLDGYSPNAEAPNNLSAYERKLVKLGKLNVIVPDRTIVFDDSDLPGPYDLLSNDEKINFLLATLSTSNLQKLNGPGIAASDVTGAQRTALLSLLPKPFTYREGVVKGIGGFSSQVQASSLPDDQFDQVRLQVFKGLEVSYGATRDGNSTQYRGLSSLDFRGPDGSPAVHSADYERRFTQQLPGRLVDNTEQKSSLDWKDLRLSKSIAMLPTQSLGDVIQTIRQQIGMEIHSDYRISKLEVDFIGTDSTAGDILRGLAFAIGGAFRKVGTLYILTSGLEGQVTKETRITARKFLEEMSIREEVNQWNAVVASKGVYQSLGFSPHDQLGAQSIPSDKLADPDSRFDLDWIPLSDVSDTIRNAIKQEEARPNRSRVAATPVPELSDKARFSTLFGYRFVLPDGRPLEFNRLRGAASIPAKGQTRAESGKPIEFSKLASGSAVGMKSNDPEVVSDLCNELRDYSIAEVWLDSQNPHAIKAAIDSGLKVDLVVRPWRVLPGETCSEPDLNLLGQAGSKLNQILAARVDPQSHEIQTYFDSFSPSDAAIESHVQKLIDLIPKQGLNRIVVLDAEPGGYLEPWPEGFGTSGFSSLSQSAPGVFEFGYTSSLRSDFIRKHQIDPIDLFEPLRSHLTPPVPFFERPVMRDRDLNYHYPRVQVPNQSLYHEWQESRYEIGRQALASAMRELSNVSNYLYIQYYVSPKFRWASGGPISVIPYDADIQKEPDFKQGVGKLTINPLNAEDDQGAVNYTIPLNLPGAVCFDLSETPTTRWPVYLRYLFRPKSNPE